MIRVLMMIDEAGTGGGQNHVALLATGLDRERFQVHLLCGEEGPLVERLKAVGIGVSVGKMSNRPSATSLVVCRREIRRFGPDLVHTHGGTAGFTGRVGSIGLRGLKRVHTYHGLHYLHDRRSLRNRMFRHVDAVLLGVTDRIICVAESDMELGKEYGVVDQEKTSVIRNGIDLAQFLNLQRNVQPGAPVVGVIGRLHIQKGHRWFLEAASKVVRDVPSARFRIIGDGELRSELMRQAAELGLRDRAEFPGDRQEIATELGEVDLLVIPSLWEGLPLVLLEAMAAGVPVVASAVDGILEAAENGREALLVPPADSSALASAMIRLLQHPAEASRLASAARLRVRREFSAERMVERTAALYDTVVTGGS